MVNLTLTASASPKTERRPSQPKPRPVIPEDYDIFMGHGIKRINSIHFNVISGNSAQPYRVTVGDVHTHCTCLRRSFHNSCSHSDAVLRYLASQEQASFRGGWLMTPDKPGDPELFEEAG